MVKLLDNMFKSIQNMCGNNDTCILLTLVFLGFLLCYIMNKEGFADLHDATETGVQMKNKTAQRTGAVPPKFGAEPGPRINTGYDLSKPVGLQPKMNRGNPPSPSVENNLSVLNEEGFENKKQPDMQQAGIQISNANKDTVMPFNEIWNPGFTPVELEFMNVNSPDKGNSELIGKYGPMGADRPMPLNGMNGMPKVPMPQQPRTGMVESTMGGNVKGKDESGKINMVFYYAPWCGHCKKMMPEWNKLEKMHANNPNVSVTKVNSDENPEEIKKQNISGFPTIKMNGKEVKNSPRTAEGLNTLLNQ